MADIKHISPERETVRNRQDVATTESREVADQNRGVPGSATADEVCSPRATASETQYSGESMDFGESGEELI